MTVAHFATGVFIFSLVFVLINGSGQSCQDLDPQACSEMGLRNSNMCMDTTLATSVCPKYCHRCPITCYNCNSSTTDVSNCNTITCNNDQVCMVKEIHSMQTGQLRYILGCADKPMCDGERKRSVYERSFSLHCCLDDLCNTPALMTTPSTVAPTPPWPMCARDILFLVESSVTFNRNYPDVKTFLQQIVRHMRIGTGRSETQISLVAFGLSLLYMWSFDRYDTEEKLLNAIQTLSPPVYMAGDAEYGLGINLLGHLPHMGDRPAIPNVYCMITGSNVSKFYSANETMSDAKFDHDNYKNVITIGVGHANHQYLSVAATDTHHALFPNTTAELLTEDFIKNVLNLMCM